MAKYKRVPDPSPPPPRFDQAFFLTLASLLAGIIVALLIALFPDARPMLWFCMALFAGLLFAALAYYAAERIKISQHHSILIFSIFTFIIVFLSAEWIGDRSGGVFLRPFSTFPSKHNSVKIAFYGSAKPQNVVGGENLYDAEVRCYSVILPNNLGSSYAVTGIAQDCEIVIVWTRPVPHSKITVIMDGKVIESVDNTSKRIYASSIDVRGVPFTGIMDVSLDSIPESAEQ